MTYPRAAVCIAGTQIYRSDETRPAPGRSTREDAAKRGPRKYATPAPSALVGLSREGRREPTRTEIASPIAMDVRSRDVVDRLAAQATKGWNAFARRRGGSSASNGGAAPAPSAWRSTRAGWQRRPPRHRVSPTDWCDITLATALELYLGGAPPPGPPGRARDGDDEGPQARARCAPLPPATRSTSLTG